MGEREREREIKKERVSEKDQYEIKASREQLTSFPGYFDTRYLCNVLFAFFKYKYDSFVWIGRKANKKVNKFISFTRTTGDILVYI